MVKTTVVMIYGCPCVFTARGEITLQNVSFCLMHKYTVFGNI